MANSKKGSREFTPADPSPSELRSASIVSPPTRLGQNSAPSTQFPRTLRNETAEFLADIDRLPILFRFFVKDLPAEMQSNDSGFVSNDTGIHSLLSIALEKMADRIRGSHPQRGTPSKQPIAIVELISSRDPLVWPHGQLKETVLCVGSLQLHLIDRTAKRGERPIDLTPREFQLLKYMMRRSDQLLTRATFLQEVWHYKFVPETNAVDVCIGKLRRKVDGPNEDPMIRNVRGAGFVLSASPSRKVLTDADSTRTQLS